eukprot:TRINITY_DN56968_c0_g2_i1.p2 TRINITY_DN56968_c0_g2~~TRINITY_DN56968_c0_g2_i1.p2  ORF type:complete len:106 (+),score=39.43 TRINITY_DN56968_c0_g2_i1:369-686(+)
MSCAQETISTLQFAQRAKKVQNSAVPNIESVQAATVAELRAQVLTLTQELEAARKLAQAAKRLSASGIETQVPAPATELEAADNVSIDRMAALERLLFNLSLIHI